MTRTALAAALAVTALAVAGCSSASEPKAQSEPKPTAKSSRTAPTCPEDGVVIKGLPVNAAMGTRAMGITLTNCGTLPYKINGYPGVRVLDEHRKPLDVKIAHGSDIVDDVGPEPLTLEPGEHATAVLMWRNRVTDVTGGAVNGAYLALTPAEDGGRPQTVRELVDLGSTGKLGVTAWHREGPKPRR
ncbi:MULTISPECIES: DUF4232 domain-containing protein [Streptomyces]|uniref:DUF4232 domain-containing protein n=1 Tax=Streptomyces rimosus subsp. rimosus TaxID=132474 RepID=A0ABY3Z2X6_STRRM|nr:MULTISPECIES: DUF4232 domain-containing protein [Streptomyces]KEF06183.1 hypothetical protein DF17_14885 [Streptomyces rimosus]KEF17788.1 hypothetical protein DF18_27250 [Streptomyces rimosus]KUJ25064.1 hypothetical protein ADK46_41550 [Streptomyces rimosus subsp. rimosus]UNZ03900.1 hypothetical protein SRIMR7_17210 [Streptomyces rimosus subsp. rimosus]UTH95407.1 hypothetical protein SRIMHP_14845 [Streptomyces rimosus subsp. rimosus]